MAFGDALVAIVQRARENDIDVNGGWECRTSNYEDYEAVIVEVAPLEEK